MLKEFRCLKSLEDISKENFISSSRKKYRGTLCNLINKCIEKTKCSLFRWMESIK
ncbi:hypothetical protein H311_02291 [Anncaliia algerae PRA109]|nr:hypothetical protein H311_02291 [Anncaliia algerae PRA109]